MKTIGLSPKVYVPTVLQILSAIVLFAFGLDVEGKTLLLTAVGTLGTGYVAAPGAVAYDPLDDGNPVVPD